MKNIKLTRNQLKLFAMFTMTLNHIVHVFGIKGIPGELLIGIGFFTAPCMCYFLVEGYYHTRSVKKYALRLFAVALLAQVPYNLAFNQDPFHIDMFNMMFTLFFCLCLCIVYNRFQAPKQFLLRVALIAMLVCICYDCDWYYLAPLMVLILLMKKTGRFSKQQAYIWMAVLYIYCNFMLGLEKAGAYTGLDQLAPETIFYACIFLAFYLLGPCMLTWALRHYDHTVVNHGSNGMKWFFYLYYPLHLLVLAGVYKIIA